MRGLKKMLGLRRSTLWPAGGSMFSLVLLAQGCPFLPTGTEFPVYEVVVVAEPASFQLGGTSQARATLKDAYGTVLTDIEVSWSSSNGSVATVTPNGGTTAVVTGVGAGVATITASAQGESGSALVQVTSSEPPPPPPPPPPPAVSSVVVALASSSLNPGATTPATATLRDADGNVLTDRAVSWSSSALGVATVSSSGGTTAVVTAVAAGSAEITATSEGKSGSQSLTVAPPSVSSVAIALTQASLNVGETAQATATVRDGSGNVLTDRTVSWSSDNPAVATVVATGATSALVTALVAGAAKITGAVDEKSGSETVTVTTGGSPSGAYPNQPSGFSVLTDRAFSVLSEDGWTLVDYVTNGLTVTVDATGPKSAPAVGQIYFPAGFEGGHSPAKTSKWIDSYGYTRLYVSFWVKLSSNWYGHPVVNKVGYIWTHGAPAFTPVYVGQGSGRLYSQVRIQDVPGGAKNLDPNLVNPEIQRGQWVRWEILLINNTGDDANGQIHWWINGTKVGQYTNIQFGTSAQSKVWERLQWDPIWGGLGSTVPASMWMWMDHWYASGAP